MFFFFLKWRTGCFAVFSVPCQSLSQFTFKATAQLSAPVVKPTLSIHIVSVKWRYVFPLCIKKKKNPQKNSPSIFINVFRWFRQWCNLCQTGSVFFFEALNRERKKTSCVLESSGALCIKISVQVERHKIRSVSPHCIINTSLFISLPIESVPKKMLPPMKYWYNFLALHVEKVIKKLGVTHWQRVAEWHVAL